MHARLERAAHSSGLCVIFLEILARLLVGCGERLQRGARRAELGRRESSALAACPCRTAAARERLRRRARRAQRMWAWRASWTPATWRRAWRRAARSPTPPRSCSWARAATRRRAPRSARPRPPTAAARLCSQAPPASLGKRCSLADPRVHKSCTLRCGLPSPQLCGPPGQAAARRSEQLATVRGLFLSSGTAALAPLVCSGAFVCVPCRQADGGGCLRRRWTCTALASCSGCVATRACNRQKPDCSWRVSTEPGAP